MKLGRFDELFCRNHGAALLDDALCLLHGCSGELLHKGIVDDAEFYGICRMNELTIAFDLWLHMG